MTLKGFIGKKVGMTQVFNDQGILQPVTVVETPPCIVLQVRTTEKEGYTAIQLGSFQAKKGTKPAIGHVRAAKLEAPFKYVKEFRVENSAEYEPGKSIAASELFNAGDHVDVTGVSIGKGFAGTVKKYHFNRGPMTHGSKFHRLPGSSGSGTTPGRVLPGSRRPGHMGAKKVTTMNLEVVEVNVEKGYMLIKGSVPGADESILLINKCAKQSKDGKKR